jgi:hypothetical protein
MMKSKVTLVDEAMSDGKDFVSDAVRVRTWLRCGLDAPGGGFLGFSQQFGFKDVAN